jgi:hypothetical protein
MALASADAMPGDDAAELVGMPDVVPPWLRVGSGPRDRGLDAVL